MARAKRAQSVNISSQTRQIKSLLDPIVPPVSLTDQESYFFNLAISCREMATWNPLQLGIACDYARLRNQIEEMEKIIATDGVYVPGPRGMMAHPLLQAKATATSSMLSLLRLMGMSASQMGVSGEPQAKRNIAEIETKKMLERTIQEDLI